jgi:ABC-type multidrug transport system permease subunit
MGDYIKMVGGYFVDPDVTQNCEFCTVAKTNTYLAGVNIDYADRWRNFGLLWVYIFFNMGAALFIYWLARMPKKTLKNAKKEKAQKA